MNKKERLLAQLKTKAASFGFSKTELESIADAIGANPELTDDATDEAVSNAVDAVLPLLKVSQQYGSRLTNEARAKQQTPEPKPEPTPTPVPPADGEPAWFKSYREAQEARLGALEAERVATSRTALEPEDVE